MMNKQTEMMTMMRIVMMVLMIMIIMMVVMMMISYQPAVFPALCQPCLQIANGKTSTARRSNFRSVIGISSADACIC